MTSRIPIGRSDLTVSPICLGTNVFGWTTDEATAFTILDAYIDAGGNFLDTANIYSAWAPGVDGGTAETIIGRWFARRGRRDDVVLATKVGMAGDPFPKGLTPEKIRAGIEGSLKRLQTDYIDLYYAHEDDEDASQEETAATFDTLVKEGKVRVLGASNFSADRLQSALAISEAENLARYEIFQPHYNLLERDFEAAEAAVCAENDLSVAPYYALARGFLTGKYRPDAELPDSPRSVGISNQYLNDRGWSVVRAQDTVAARHGASNTAVALAWLRAKDTVIAPIASATSTSQVDTLVEAAQLELSADDVALLDDAGTTVTPA